MLKSEHVYRVPLCCFCDIGKINFSFKIDFKIKYYLERDIKKLFESKKKSKRNWCSFSPVRTIFTR